MDKTFKSLQNWILSGAVPPTPASYDNALVKYMMKKYSIGVLFYVGDLPDDLRSVKTGHQKVSFLDDKLNVYARSEGKEEFEKRDYKFVYSCVQGEKQVNFIDYKIVHRVNIKYLVEHLWKSCHDGSVIIIKNYEDFLNDSGLTLKSIHQRFNGEYVNKKYYTVRAELGMIIIEKDQ